MIWQLDFYGVRIFAALVFSLLSFMTMSGAGGASLFDVLFSCICDSHVVQ